jgi:hypothetical protein
MLFFQLAPPLAPPLLSPNAPVPLFLNIFISKKLGSMEPLYIFSEKIMGWIGVFSDASYAFCNYHLDGFWYNGQWFPSMEHFFQFQKALFFSDPISAESIRKADSSTRAHMLGRIVKNFSKDEWSSHSRHVCSLFSLFPHLCLPQLDNEKRINGEIFAK